MKLSLITLLFLSVVFIGYKLDTKESYDMYRKLYMQSSIDYNTIKSLSKISSLQKDSILLKLNESNNKLDCYQDSMKSFRKYKKLYNQSLIKDTIKIIQ